MKKILIERFGDSRVLQLIDVDPYEPGEGQIVVAVKAAGVNPKDVFYREGTYPHLKSPPFVPGIDSAGFVKKIGHGVTRFAEGDRVYTYGSLTGTYAEEVLCEERHVFHLPTRLTFSQGAGIGVPYTTAFRAIFHRAKAIPGETILVHGASGGVGLAAVQIAASCGFVVIGTAGSDEGLQIIREEGAFYAANHYDKSYLENIIKTNNGNKMDVILEMQPALNLQKDLTILSNNGRIVMVGGVGPATFNITDLKDIDAKILAVSLLIAPKEDLQVMHSSLQQLLRSGNLNPRIYKEYPLALASKAQDALFEKGRIGKIILIP